MAWCPKCEGNYSIVTSVEGSSYSVPVTTERYNRAGEYIGYEESTTYSTHMETLPRCSNCYSVLEFPNATSKEEYFRAIQKKLIEKHRTGKPSKPVGAVGCAFISVVGGLLIGVIAYFAVKNLDLAILIVLIVAVALGVYGFRSGRSDREEYEDKVKHWERKLNELQSMKYSEENYKRLCQENKTELEKIEEYLDKIAADGLVTKEEWDEVSELIIKLPELPDSKRREQLVRRVKDLSLEGKMKNLKPPKLNRN